MLGELVIVFFLIRYLRQAKHDSPELIKWDQVFRWALCIIPVLALIEILKVAPAASRWLGHLILLACVAGGLTLPEFRSVRNIVFAIIPYAIVSVLEDLTKLVHTSFTDLIATYLKILSPFTVLWLVALVIISNKQRKALQKERDKRALEEQQNRVIAARKAELEQMVTERTSALLQQKEELEHALSELKDTQAQLIQSEKMASLGELTAGIAHEIQNPLNFVNNFSEINKELIEEMEQEIVNGNLEEVKAIASDIRENELKINQHGKRADAIVKGMLQHSRASSGTKEPTDINALADEYLRLSYHGLRAKDKSFNASFKTDLDESIGKISIIPQDLGRVLLNLCNNAFYAVNEKKKNADVKGGEKYEPTVYISTKKADGVIRICVKDNGNGIPQKVLDKIYQPFFTTKPTGQGTGLGLSLSYDIVKAHGGEITVETKEGEGTQFIIQLPAVATS